MCRYHSKAPYAVIAHPILGSSMFLLGSELSQPLSPSRGFIVSAHLPRDSIRKSAKMVFCFCSWSLLDGKNALEYIMSGPAGDKKNDSAVRNAIVF